MSKLFRIFLVAFALMGLAATATGCGGGGGTDASDGGTE